MRDTDAIPKQIDGLTERDGGHRVVGRAVDLQIDVDERRCPRDSGSDGRGADEETSNDGCSEYEPRA